ncbi:MAG: hypothetical protein U0M37_05290 [Blautia sp.]
MTDARGNILSDIYDEADCLKSVSMKVGEGGGSQTVENTGFYMDDDFAICCGKMGWR